MSQKEDLYKVLSANLEIISDGKYKGFACPLCRKLFCINQMDKLTIEHSIPKAVGGKPGTLTCKECNNKLGSEIDASLATSLKMEQFFDGSLGSDVRHQLHTPTGKATVNISLSRDGIELVMDVEMLPKHSNPQQYRNAQKDLGKGGPIMVGCDIDNTKHFDEYKANLALLKAAYLRMFEFFGYGYICSQSADKVLKTIVDPNNNCLPLSKMIGRIDPEECRDGVAVTVPPEHLRSFLIPLNLKCNGKIASFVVLLPWFGKDTVDITSWENGLGIAANPNLQVRWFPLDPMKIADRETYRWPQEIWDCPSPEE
jgi:hypothetical protein